MMIEGDKMKMKKQKYLFIVILSITFLFLRPSSSTVSAEESCSGIGPFTVIRWDSTELKVGQIGRLTILKDTPLYRLNGNIKVTSRTLKAGETYRIYAFKPGKLSVGGGLYVDRDARIKYETPSKVKLSQLSCKKLAIEDSNRSVHMNDSFSTVAAKLGKEKRTSLNEYKVSWYTYHQGYNHYYMVSFINNKVNGLFTMDKGFYINNIHVGSTINEVKSSFGVPIKGILKGNVNYLLSNSNEIQTFLQNGAYITVFYDIHNKGQVTGIQIISKKLEDRKSANFAMPTPALQPAFEMQLFDLINAARVKSGLSSLKWDEKARTASRKHSLDMAANNFFDHINLKGEDPFERMTAEGIQYRAAGENIAMGYSSSIFAHEAFMNSLGHRENVLNPVYTSVGVGVHFQQRTNSPYFTQDFFTP
jgi:uncharacterized protein YkwD